MNNVVTSGITISLQYDQYLSRHETIIIKELAKAYCNVTEWITLIGEYPTSDERSRFIAKFDPKEKVVKVSYEIFNGQMYFTDKKWEVVTAKVQIVTGIEEAMIVVRRIIRELVKKVVFQEKKKNEW